MAARRAAPARRRDRAGRCRDGAARNGAASRLPSVPLPGGGRSVDGDDHDRVAPRNVASARRGWPSADQIAAEPPHQVDEVREARGDRWPRRRPSPACRAARPMTRKPWRCGGRGGSRPCRRRRRLAAAVRRSGRRPRSRRSTPLAAQPGGDRGEPVGFLDAQLVEPVHQRRRPRRRRRRRRASDIRRSSTARARPAPRRPSAREARTRRSATSSPPSLRAVQVVDRRRPSRCSVVDQAGARRVESARSRP